MEIQLWQEEMLSSPLLFYSFQITAAKLICLLAQ